MIIEEILNVLKSDAVLTELLGATKEDSKIYMYDTTTKTDCVVYSYVQLTNDKVKAQSRLEIDVSSIDYIKANTILDRVKCLLLTLGDDGLTNNVLEVVQNGGGQLFLDDIKTHQFKAIFSIKERVV